MRYVAGVLVLLALLTGCDWEEGPRTHQKDCPAGEPNPREDYENQLVDALEVAGWSRLYDGNPPMTAKLREVVEDMQRRRNLV